MLPVDQTIFGDGKGNCFAACVASLLHYDLSRVPNFCADYPGDRWWSEFRTWLHEQRLDAFYFKFAEWGTSELDLPVGLFWIASGKSPRGDFLHSVVYNSNELAHDPHWSRMGIVGEPRDGIFLVSFDLGRLITKGGQDEAQRLSEGQGEPTAD